MTSYLVAGAGQGIGREFVNQLSQLSSTSVVYAGVRDLSTAPETFSSDPKIHIVQLDVLRQSDVDAAAETVRKTTGSLDVLIINAGIGTGGYIAQCSTQQIQECLEVNTVAPHRLIQAFLPLIRIGVQKKIVALGTSVGSFGLIRALVREAVPSGAYGISKAALHFLMMLYAADLTPAEGILFAALDPGVVPTSGAQEWGKQFKGEGMVEKFETIARPLISAEESVQGLLKVVEGLTAERSGDLLAWNGDLVPY